MTRRRAAAAALALSTAVLILGGTVTALVVSSTGAMAAGKTEGARMAKLTFTLSVDSTDAKGAPAQTATAMIILPAPIGAAVAVSRGSYSKSYEAAETEPTGEGTVTWNDKGVPSTRVTTSVRTREDGRLWIGYSVEMLDDAGTAPSTVAGQPPVRLVNGPSLSGQVILPSAGGKATVGELRDRKGRHITVDIDGAALEVN
jgi:hypothetical protein